MKILTDISRIVVGALFIVSGFIKANDPMGFAFKLNDYFAPDVLDLAFLNPYALAMSAFICIIEIVHNLIINILRNHKKVPLFLLTRIYLDLQRTTSQIFIIEEFEIVNMRHWLPVFVYSWQIFS